MKFGFFFLKYLSVVRSTSLSLATNKKEHIFCADVTLWIFLGQYIIKTMQLFHNLDCVYATKPRFLRRKVRESRGACVTRRNHVGRWWRAPPSPPLISPAKFFTVTELVNDLFNYGIF